MSPRLTALAACLLALALVTGSGAFDAVVADRSAVVDVASDADALLGLTPHSGPNGAFTYVSGGELVLDVSGTNPNSDATAGPIYGATGINARSLTRVDDVFDVTNQGTAPVCVWLTEDSTAVSLFATTDDHGSVQTPGEGFVLTPGETLTVGFAVDSRGVVVGDRLLDGVTIHADADIDCGTATGGV